ncbi:DUF1801 domain-containing protein [Sulfitobacter sp. LCG007]
MSDAAVEAFLEAVEPEGRLREARRLDRLFRDATGLLPALWPGGIIGYGRYDYTYATGRSGSSFATGFAPRKAKISVYVMPGYAGFDAILTRLGRHSRGKACIYFNRLEEVDCDVLAELIRAGLEDLATHWPVMPA